MIRHVSNCHEAKLIRINVDNNYSVLSGSEETGFTFLNEIVTLAAIVLGEDAQLIHEGSHAALEKNWYFIGGQLFAVAWRLCTRG